MDANKDEAFRCLRLAETALSSGNKERAARLVKFAERLDPSLNIVDLLAALGNFGCQNDATHKEGTRTEQTNSESNGDSRSCPSDHSYSEEHISVIHGIKKSTDYYVILGVDRNCSMDEVRKAYKRLSLKVHPDKNKAPGAEEAFKSVSRAFNCLNDEQSRKAYDQEGKIGNHEFTNQQRGAAARRRPSRRRRSRANGCYSDDGSNPDEIFRSFFCGAQYDNMYRANSSYWAGGAGVRHQREHLSTHGRMGFSIIMLFHVGLILIIWLFAFISSQQPEYSLHPTSFYSMPKFTKRHGVEYFVRKEDFDWHFPEGSMLRGDIEFRVLRDYQTVLGRHCHGELQRRHWAKDVQPTPHCDKLRSLM